jgi:hypothetical protein
MNLKDYAPTTVRETKAEHNDSAHSDKPAYMRATLTENSTYVLQGVNSGTKYEEVMAVLENC